MVTLTLPYNAVFGQAGHFNEDGTPQAGHEQDYLGPCQTPPPPTDVCPNIDGNQATVPDGMVKDEQGDCVTPPPPPTDVCPNIEGNQATVPAGMVKDEQVRHASDVSTPTAGTSWYKVYTWDVEKSVDRSQLNLKQGETGSVEWKVDVTQTGWTAQNMVVGGTITVGNPNGTAVTGVFSRTSFPTRLSFVVRMTRQT